jgi:hypothetical protein
MLGQAIEAGFAAGGNLLGGGGGGGKSPGDRRNDLRDTLNQFLAVNPFKNAEDTAQHDLRKVRGESLGLKGNIGEQAWNAMGSSNPNIVGVNKTIEDYVGRGTEEDPGAHGLDYESGRSWLKTALGAALAGGSVLAAPFTGGASLALTGGAAEMARRG